jgi:hypothetical protein
MFAITEYDTVAGIREWTTLFDEAQSVAGFIRQLGYCNCLERTVII